VEESTEWPQRILDKWRVIGAKEGWKNTKDAIIEAECTLLSSISESLIMHHPYRPLQVFLKDSVAEKDCTSNAWSMVNDAFIFDVGLTHPP